MRRIPPPCPPQPAWSHFWFGNIESGDTEFLTSRGYAHVVAQARGEMYKNIYNLLYPYDQPQAMAEEKIRRVKPPVYTGSGQYAIDYHFHWQGAPNWFRELDLPDGACCVADTEYIPCHICRNATVCHKIYRDGARPSQILPPVIPHETAACNTL